MEQPMQRDPNAPSESSPFSDGYHEGQTDLLYGIAQGHQWALEKLEISEPVYKAVERILDEKSAWIAAPNPEVVKSIALQAVVAAQRIMSITDGAAPDPA